MLTITYGYTGSSTRTISLADTATALAQTSAIQSALKAVAGFPGAVVTLSAGTFTVIGTGTAADGVLRVGSETTLQGAGMGLTTIKLADGSAGVTGIIRTDSGSILADGSVKTTSNVSIKGLTIDGNMARTTGATDGFYCGPQPGTSQHDSNITLDRVEIMNASRYGFDPHEQTVGLTISNSVAHHNGVDGFVIDHCSSVQLINDSAYANARHGINIVTGSSGVTIANASIHDNGGTGVVVQTGDNEIRAFTNHVTISGGSIANNGGFGVDVHQATDVAISTVAISGNGGHGISLLGVERVALAGNTIRDVPSPNDAVRIDGYKQDFGDAIAANDRYIATKSVTIDGVVQPDPLAPSGVTPWTYKVSDGNDTIAGGGSNDAIAAGNGDDVVSGGGGHDVLNGEDGNDTLSGDDGNDTLSGGAGNDTVLGGAGNDKLTYASGLDRFDGGTGTDTVDFSKAGPAVFVNLGALSGFEAWTSGTWSSNATNATTAIADIANVENVTGSSHSDMLLGNGGNNILDGSGGNDIVDAGSGADTVYGGSGSDSLNGGSGNDYVNGGSGNDTLAGGAGNDVFRFNTRWGSDTVTDFTAGSDKIDFYAIAGLASVASLTITPTAGGTDIAFGTSHILLPGVSPETLSATDFLFH